MEYITTVEAAEKWHISRRRVNVLCDQGRIEGAVLKGKLWLIPDSTEKPADGRSTRYSSDKAKE